MSFVFRQNFEIQIQFVLLLSLNSILYKLKEKEEKMNTSKENDLTTMNIWQIKGLKLFKKYLSEAD